MEPNAYNKQISGQTDTCDFSVSGASPTITPSPNPGATPTPSPTPGCPSTAGVGRLCSQPSDCSACGNTCVTIGAQPVKLYPTCTDPSCISGVKWLENASADKDLITPTVSGGVQKIYTSGPTKMCVDPVRASAVNSLSPNTRRLNCRLCL